ncbi:cytochrome c biogenesis protein [bacterium]|nr:cytochrome c biogenesis protein [bacterium]
MPNYTFSNGFFIVLGLYLVSFLAFCFRFIFKRKVYALLALRFTMVGLLVHGIVFITHLLKQGYPYFNTSFESLQLTSLIIVLFFVIFSFFYHYLAAGLIFMFLGLFFYILSITRLVAYAAPQHFLQNPWAFIHLVFIFMGVGVFMVSFVTGLIYLIKEYRLKHKQLGGFFDKVPALDELDAIHYRSLYTGFVLFTLGIITGAGWSKSTLGYYVTNDLKSLLSIGIWIFFALLLNLRVSQGLQGRKGILLSTMGFVLFLYLLFRVQGGGA